MVYRRFCSIGAIGLATVFATIAPAFTRESIRITGSSTVLPYAIIVSEAFSENFDYPTPVVESGGTASGLKRFCQGVGTNTVDIANASRRIRPREINACIDNGVTDIIEVRIGYDGIVFASDKTRGAFALEPRHIYRALSATVFNGDQEVANPYKDWRAIDPALPPRPITLFIPGTKHGTREVFEDKVIVAGCMATGDFARLQAVYNGDEQAAAKHCMALRTDGLSVDIDGDYTETLARLNANRDAIGVFGLSFYENNTDRLDVAAVSGTRPTAATIASGAYPVSRPLFFYLKKAHIGVVPGLKAYAEFFISDDIAGAGGPLATYGLVVDPDLPALQQTLAAEHVIAPGG